MTRAENVSRNSRVEELKTIMADMKSKCDSFKFNLDNRVDKMNEHCNFLRNQVHLETELLIEKAHQFNENLIGEIDKYEQDYILSSKSEVLNASLCQKLIDNANLFLVDTANHLEEFTINDTIVEESLASAVKMIQDFENEEEAFELAKLQFTSYHDDLDKSLLGSLAIKQKQQVQGKQEILKFNKVNLENIILSNYLSNMYLFRNENGNYAAFYIDQNSMLSVSIFDSAGSLLKVHNKVIEASINKLRVAKSDVSKTFFIYVSLTKICEHFMVKDSQIYCLDISRKINYKHFLIKMDENIDFENHLGLSDSIDFLAANSSQILCIKLTYLLDIKRMRL
jgi:hypothetical protein